MAKPICKREAKWIHWRSDYRMSRFTPDGFSKWSKREMVRARRRYSKTIVWERDDEI